MIDASTVVSAALSPAGLARQAIALARAQGLLALSEPVYKEVAAVLERPKFARTLTEDRRFEILALLTAAAIWAEPEVKIDDCRDQKDNCYLELSLAVSAAALVTGDEDLLVLHPWRGVLILRPADFLDQFNSGI